MTIKLLTIYNNHITISVHCFHSSYEKLRNILNDKNMFVFYVSKILIKKQIVFYYQTALIVSFSDSWNFLPENFNDILTIIWKL